jgi:hypothetical protein
MRLDDFEALPNAVSRDAAANRVKLFYESVSVLSGLR